MNKILKSAMVLSLVASPALAEDMYTSLSLGTGRANVHQKTDNKDISVTKFKSSMPFAGEIAVGTNVAPNIRAEVAYGFMQYSVKGKTGSTRRNYTEDLSNPLGQSFPDANLITNSKAQVKTHSLMLNGYYDFAPWDVVTPYVMGGIGIAKNTFTGHDTLIVNDTITVKSPKIKHSSTNLIWQVGAGFEVDAGDNVKIGLGYRYKHIHGAVNKKNANGTKVRLKPIHLALATVRIGL